MYRPLKYIEVFLGGSDGKESAYNTGDPGSTYVVRRIPWIRNWLPTPVFLPGEFHGQRSLEGYSPWDHERVRHNLVTKQ